MYSKMFELRQTRYNTLLEIEGEMMEFGNFSWSDIQRLKVIERRFHVKRINEMLKRKTAKQSLK